MTFSWTRLGVVSFVILTACEVLRVGYVSTVDPICTPGDIVETTSCADSEPGVVAAEQTTICNAEGDGHEAGDCLVRQCMIDFDLVANQCVPISCKPGEVFPAVDCAGEVAFSTAATKTKSCNAAGDGYTYGECTVTECVGGYLISNNACLVEQCTANQDYPPVSCPQEIPYSTAATRTRTCNGDGTDYVYGPCTVTTCEVGYQISFGACFAADEVLVATATPDAIIEDETSTLAWRTTDAVSTVLVDGVSMPLNGSVTAYPLVTTAYVVKALDDTGAIIARIDVEITVTPLPPPELPDPPTGVRSFITGTVPTDGFLESTPSGHRYLPDLKDGQRLSGTVTIGLHNAAYLPEVPYRLVVDGVPQPSLTIDTTAWPDGSHFVALQVTDPMGYDVANAGRVVIFNNSGVPFTSLEGQAVFTGSWSDGPLSLAWGRVNVIGPSAIPLDPQLDLHPSATTEVHRQRLATERIWWVEGLTHQPTPLFQTMPVLMKNRHGDYFVKQFNPESKRRLTPSSAFPFIETAPAYDGPRGIGWINAYTTFTPAPEVLHSGQTGWLGVDLSGRVTRVDITGEVTTILGPRSVAGVVGTNNDEVEFDLAARLASGEKEYVGDHGGLPLAQATDIWTCNSFPFEGVIADTGNNRVVEIHFEKRKLMRSWSVPAVSSVWASLETQQAGNAWYAANPDGLWTQRIIMDPVTGAPTGHGSIEQVAEIPNAFWVRGDRMRVYVLTLDLGIYEYFPETDEVVLRRPREGASEQFAFLAVDENGSIGPRGRIYRGSTGTALASAYKTSVYYHDPDDWTEGKAFAGAHNRVIYGSWTAGHLGHYMWGFALHESLPKFISNGVTGSSWFLWTGLLGELPAPDAPLSHEGIAEWRYGERDEYPALSSIFGFNGHGDIGYSCEAFRDYTTWDEARTSVRAYLDPLFPPAVPEVDRENIARQLFVQRTRKHFQ